MIGVDSRTFSFADPVYIQRPKFARMDTSKPAGFSLELKTINVKERRAARLTCATVGRPEPEITWYKGETNVDEAKANSESFKKWWQTKQEL